MKNWLYQLNAGTLWHRQLKVWGHRFIAPSLDRLLYLALHKARCMGQTEHHLFGQWIRPGTQAVDIGANIGLYSVLLAKLTGPAGRVYAFEPEPTLFQALKANCESQSNIQLWDYALGQKTGQTQLHRSIFNSGDNRLNGLNTFSQAVSVKMTRLDIALPEAPIDFIKMDVQGHELDVLEGMAGLLKSTPQLKIYFEYWKYGILAAGRKPQDIYDYLRDYGFQIYSVARNHFSLIENWPVFEKQCKKNYTNLLAKKE